MIKYMKASSILLTLALILSLFTGCAGGTLALSDTVLTLEASESYSLSVVPDSGQPVTWSSSDPSTATVSETGVVTAVSEGMASITAEAPAGKAVCEVTVTTPVTAIVLLGTPPTVNLGEALQLQVSIFPADAADTALSWNSSAPAVAMVDEAGRVTPGAVGTVTITVTATNGITASYTLQVVLPATGITLSEAERTITISESFALAATVTPDGADQTIAWSSSDPGIASVDAKGMVTGVSAGTAVITAAAQNGLSTACTVQVTAPASGGGSGGGSSSGNNTGSGSSGGSSGGNSGGSGGTGGTGGGGSTTTPPPAPSGPWDKPYDIAAITAELRAYAQSVGLIWDDSLTLDNSHWITPDKTSNIWTGEKLRQSIKSDISYLATIETYINVYWHAIGDGNYYIYYLRA